MAIPAEGAGAVTRHCGDGSSSRSSRNKWGSSRGSNIGGRGSDSDNGRCSSRISRGAHNLYKTRVHSEQGQNHEVAPDHCIPLNTSDTVYVIDQTKVQKGV